MTRHGQQDPPGYGESLLPAMLILAGVALVFIGVPAIVALFVVGLLTGLCWPLPWITVAFLVVLLVVAAGLASISE